MSTGAIVYEVNLDVESAIANAYLDWLRPHVEQMTQLPGFTSATVFALSSEDLDADRVGWCVQYRLRDRAALDDYLREHAPRLRDDGVARFGALLRAPRRIIPVVQSAARTEPREDSARVPSDHHCPASSSVRHEHVAAPGDGAAGAAVRPPAADRP